jgi:hypothetical protein
MRSAVKNFVVWSVIGTASLVRADDAPAELKAIQAKYDLATLDSHEAKREKYIMELSALHWHLVRHDLPGLDAVDFEINRHPVPAAADDKALAKLRVGTWQSPRHDYLYRADGTWTMDPDAGIPDATHGTWSIHGNEYTETTSGAVPAESTTYTIILLNDTTFIFAEPGTAGAYYERREGKGHLPLRRDDPAP